MKFPCDIVFRNELLRTGRELAPCASQEDLEARAAAYRSKARTMRRFVVWVAIERRTGKEIEIARGEQ